MGVPLIFNYKILKRILFLKKIAQILNESNKDIDEEVEQEEKRRIEAAKEKEAAEQERLKSEFEKKAKMKSELQHSMQEYAEVKEKQLEEINNKNRQEELNRLKKSNFDYEIKVQEFKRKLEKQKNYAEYLKKQILQKVNFFRR